MGMHSVGQGAVSEAGSAAADAACQHGVPVNVLGTKAAERSKAKTKLGTSQQLRWRREAKEAGNATRGKGRPVAGGSGNPDGQGTPRQKDDTRARGNGAKEEFIKRIEACRSWESLPDVGEKEDANELDSSKHEASLPPVKANGGSIAAAMPNEGQERILKIPQQTPVVTEAKLNRSHTIGVINPGDNQEQLLTAVGVAQGSCLASVDPAVQQQPEMNVHAYLGSWAPTATVQSTTACPVTSVTAPDPPLRIPVRETVGHAPGAEKNQLLAETPPAGRPLYDAKIHSVSQRWFAAKPVRLFRLDERPGVSPREAPSWPTEALPVHTWCTPLSSLTPPGFQRNETAGPGHYAYGIPVSQPSRNFPLTTVKRAAEEHQPPNTGMAATAATEQHSQKRTVSLPPLRRNLSREHHYQAPPGYTHRSSDGELEDFGKAVRRATSRGALLQMEVKLGSLGLDKDSEDYQARLEKYRKQQSYAAKVRVHALAVRQHHRQNVASSGGSCVMDPCSFSSSPSSQPAAENSAVLTEGSKIARPPQPLAPILVGNHPGPKEMSEAAARRLKMKQYASGIKRPTAFLAPLADPRKGNSRRLACDNATNAADSSRSSLEEEGNYGDGERGRTFDDSARGRRTELTREAARLVELERQHRRGMEDVMRIRKELRL